MKSLITFHQNTQKRPFLAKLQAYKTKLSFTYLSSFFVFVSKYLGPTKQQPFATKTGNATTFSKNVRNQIKVEKTKVTKVTKARANFELWSISSHRGPYAPPPSHSRVATQKYDEIQVHLSTLSSTISFFQYSQILKFQYIPVHFKIGKLQFQYIPVPLSIAE